MTPGFDESGLPGGLADSERSRHLLRVVADAMLDPQVLLEAVRDSQGRVVDFLYVEVNRATCEYLGLSRDDLLHQRLMSKSPGVAEVGLLAEYVRCLDTGEPVVHNDFTYDNEILADTRRYDIRASRATPTSITLTWRDVTERFRMAHDIARADALYRRSMESAAVGMFLADPEGNFVEVNDALCGFFGYDAATLRHKTWQELTASEYQEADLSNRAAVLAGDIDSYRLTEQYIRANGRHVWGDLAVSCLRGDDGQVEIFIGQITDITAQVEADERNRELSEVVQQQSERLTSELHSAVAYVSSILPGDLDGPVRVSSRYLPSQQLAGDIFDYRWIDDDHLLVYLIDVSGHGISPALLSVSIHNMLRSGSLPLRTLLAPGEVLAELNRRFPMDDQDGHYLTMWCGVYESSTRTLRYANAGAPPAFAIHPGGTKATELSTGGQPLGMFDDTSYISLTHTVPPGYRVLIFSDGAYESGLDHGHQLSVTDFKKLFTRMAGSPLDDLVGTLKNLTPSGDFDDDCTLVSLVFD